MRRVGRNILLKENVSERVYHFTSLPAYLKMVQEDTIYLQNAFAGKGADMYDAKRPFYLSLSRNKSVRMGYGSKYNSSENYPVVRIEFDGRALNADFRSRPVDYWRASMGKQSYYEPGSGESFSKSHSRFEYEDRIFSVNESISPASKYISRVDIYVPEKDMNVREMLFSARFPEVETRYYTSLKDFSLQSDNYLEDDDVFQGLKFSYEKHTDFIGTHSKQMVLEYFGKVMRFISDSPKEDGGVMMRRYRLEKYMPFYMKGADSREWGGPSVLVDSLMSHMQSLSREPDRDGSLILRMISDLFRQYGFESPRDIVEYCSRDVYSRKREEKQAEELQGLWEDVRDKEFLVVSYRNNLSIDPENADFWDFYTRGMSNNERNYAINTFIDNLHYYVTTDGYGANPHKSRDDEYFKKYLQHIAINGVTINKMIDILDKLNITWMFDEIGIRMFEMSGEQIRMNYRYNIVETDGMDNGYEISKKIGNILLRRCEEEGI